MTGIYKRNNVRRLLSAANPVINKSYQSGFIGLLTAAFGR